MKYLINLGGMKCATNTLYFLLSQHPEIERSHPKELDYFLESRGGSKHEYETCFNLKVETRCLFEATTQYMKYPLSPDASANMDILASDLQFTALLRDPLKRLESHVYHVLARSKNQPRLGNLVTAAYECSRYYYQLSPYLDRFGNQQLLSFFFEDFIHNQPQIANAIVKQLGLTPFEFSSVGIKNERRVVESPPQFDLISTLGPTRLAKLVNDVECLEVILGQSTRHAWKGFWERVETL